MANNKLSPKASLVPWTVASSSLTNFVHPDTTSTIQGGLSSQWRDGQIAELGTVNITAALIAAVVGAAFSWPAVNDSPWTSKAALYASLILALSTVASASQQSIALYRYGQHPEGLQMLRNHLADTTGKKTVKRLQLYVWQMPVMLLNISIFLLLVGLFILIWDRATQKPAWDGDMKIAFVASLAGIYALVNYVIGAIALYKK